MAKKTSLAEMGDTDLFERLADCKKSCSTCASSSPPTNSTIRLL